MCDIFYAIDCNTYIRRLVDWHKKVAMSFRRRPESIPNLAQCSTYIADLCRALRIQDGFRPSPE
jgi:hypothetical protein